MTTWSNVPAGPGAPPLLTEQAEDIEQIWDAFFYIALGIGAIVVALLGWVILRYRHRDDVLPVQRHAHIPLEIGYTVVPLLIVVGLFAVTFGSVRAIDELGDDTDLVIEVTGFQWQWQFEYPESGVTVVGDETTDAELVLPAGASVRFEMTSVDVIHSFWIPAFRFKRDVIPGIVTRFEVDVGDSTGAFPGAGVCAEFCGLDHHKMGFDVRVVTADEFEAWAAREARR